MTKLSDTQRVILSAAAQHTDRMALPLPKSLKGGAARKVVDALIAKNLLKEVKANIRLGDPVWRENEQGRSLTLIITDTGFAAIGVEPAPQKTPAPPTATDAEPPVTPWKTRAGTKQALVIEMLRRPEGATIAEIVEATDWASHTTRGFFAGALKKKLGLTITSEKDTAGIRRYRLH